MNKSQLAEYVPRRGRARSETTRRAIVAAAGELLLEHGLGSISMDAVAERAGASKATIYRWWSSKELLALDALLTEWENEAHDTGSLAGDLLTLIRPWVGRLNERSYGRIIAGLLTRAQSDPAFAAEYRARFVDPRRDEGRNVLARAIDRGEVPPDIDVEAVLDLLYGPIYHRMMQGHLPLTDGFARMIVGFVVAAVSRPAGPS